MQSTFTLTVQRPLYILPLIVLTQFAGTSLWFAGNAILADIPALATRPHAIGHITSAVQIGFIIGTLVFAILTIADRFSPVKVFFVSSLLAAGFNACTLWVADNYGYMLLFRFLTGFMLAGIYPVGMKIAADWFDKGLGKALGYLVGALVLGTAFPHFLKGVSVHFSWQQVVLFTSAFALTGGLLILTFVPDGPFKKQGSGFHPRILGQVFRSKEFKAASFGYFGHMWELYTLWAFVPVMLTMNTKRYGITYNVPLWSFIIIGIGGISCMTGGYLSQKIGSARVARYALVGSCICAASSFFFINMPPWIFLPYLIIWGITVTPDSPQFSSLTALAAPPAYKGTAVTAVVCIGFTISIISIQIISYLFTLYPQTIVFTTLAIGPLLGIIAFRRQVAAAR
ncbi:MAG: MFS transporter [Niastella sp.]|nr:MFS transporter [Niastella sp.]